MTAVDSRFSWLALAAVPGIGPVSYKALITAFGHPEGVFAADEAALRAAGMGDRVVKGLMAYRPRPELHDEIKKAEDLGLEIITLADPAYPTRLQAIPDPPPYIYVKGTISDNDAAAMAIVGSREATHYGREVSVRLARDLAGRGMTIVSGLARGVDACAHRGALDVGGRTIAVLGCGLDYPLPRDTVDMARQIAASGALIAEFPLGTTPSPENFPKRNRIISGLSLGTLVVEAVHGSGSLITAQYAKKQGRTVFAVPGNIISSRSDGTNALLKEGARLVMTAEDIIAELGASTGKKPDGVIKEVVLPRPLLTPEEEKVYKNLSREPVHIDRLSSNAGMAVHQVSGILMMLELKGAVRQLPGKMFIAD
ncbi:MAG: DNA-processing protein DprA [Nitrospirota bacterium]|nr:DNA-processing protein DprA [Nitrospirota bacterium]